MDNQLEHVEIHISKEDVNRLNKSQVRQMIMISSIFRDILLAQKIYLLIKTQSSDNEAMQSTNKVNSWSILILFVSRIYAACEFIEKGVDNVSLTDDLVSKHNDIINAFDGNIRLLFRHIRNKYGSHYEHRQEIEDGLYEAVKDLPEIKMYLCTTSGNDSFEFASLAQIIEIIEYMKKLKFRGVNVPVEKNIFESIVTDIDKLWADLMQNGYVDNEGVIRAAFADLADWRDMKMNDGYTDKQKDDIYSALKHSGLFHELIITALNISGLLDDYLKKYLMEVVFKGINFENKMTIKTKVTNLSAISIPMLFAFEKK